MIINVLVKDVIDVEKVLGNFEGISKLSKKFKNRYEIRIKLDKILLNYLTQIELVLPILEKIKFEELYLNLMKVLGYFFYNFILIL
jgi:hypothetical protein